MEWFRISIKKSLISHCYTVKMKQLRKSMLLFSALVEGRVLETGTFDYTYNHKEEERRLYCSVASNQVINHLYQNVT